MIISRNFEYRTDYSKTTYGAEQSINLEDNLPFEIVQAETMLLGLRVRYLVNSEVYDARDYPNEEYMVDELLSLRATLSKAVGLLRSVCLEADCGEREPYDYHRFRDFLSEAKLINTFVKTALAELTPPTVQTV